MNLKEEQVVSIQNLDTDTTLAIAYEAFKKLNWSTLFAGPDKLLANTIKKWNIQPQQIIVGVAGSFLHVSSEMINNEKFDVAGRNKKNISEFVAAFQSLENAISVQTIEANRQAINQLREKTQEVAEEHAVQSKEAEKIMHFSQRNLAVTYGIIILNALVFIAMVVTGISIYQPTAFDVIPWGANLGPLTLSGEWWRLIANTFLHFGILHIGFNMYALYMVGIYLEPMLGKIRYTVAYLCTGVLASLASLWWHLSNPVTSAGASGAIFGMYGVFLALLSTNLIPQRMRKALLKSIGIFVVYNLAFGLTSGIDNAGHIGGLISGLLIGYAYYFTLKKEFSTKSILVVSALVIAATAGGTYLFLQKTKKPTVEEIKELKSTINEGNYSDVNKFGESYNRVIELQNEANAIDTAAAMNVQKPKVKSYTERLEKWQEAARIATEMKGYNVSDRLKLKAATLGNYVQERLDEIRILQQIENGSTPELNDQLKIIQERINKTVDSLQSM
jgi:rhomboid protease GluP